MNERELLADIFDEKWKDKYVVHYCDMCQVFIISCKECRGSTCNCHSCEKCEQDFEEFRKFNRSILNYLTGEEIKTFQKIDMLKTLMYKSLSKGEQRLDFKQLQKDGELSKNEEEIFEKELI